MDAQGPENMGNLDFETLVNLYYGDLYRFALSLARNPDDACDLTQQTFTVFAEKKHQVREADRVKSWLFTTLYREFLRLQERNKRHVSTDAGTQEIPEPAVASGVESRVDQSELLQVLASLDEEQRAVLGLFYLEQHSYKEMAEILGIPIGTVMSRLSRAKEALKKKFDALDSGKGIKTDSHSSNQERKEANG